MGVHDPGSTAERLSRARETRAREDCVQQERAVRTVDDHATDPQDRAMLIAMLGLDRSGTTDNQPRHVGPLT